MARYTATSDTFGTWQPSEITFPDTLSLVVLHMRPLLAPAKVATSLVGWKRPEPCVQFTRTGGSARGLFDAVDLQVDVRAETLDDTQAFTSLARKHLANLPNALDEVKMVAETGGVTWLPDPEDNQPRMTWTVAIRVMGQ